jgi:hypothetical protein
MKIDIVRGDQRLTLNVRQARQFMREFTAVTRRRASRKGLPRDIPLGYDLAIEFHVRRKVSKRYRLYARAVLFEERTGRIWNFYFGLLLWEWMRVAFPGRKVPSIPVPP